MFFEILFRGYYPAGGGEFEMKVKPVKNLNSVALSDPGSPSQIFGWSYVAGVVPLNVSSYQEDQRQ